LKLKNQEEQQIIKDGFHPVILDTLEKMEQRKLHPL
jgi:hypothetical protein